MNSDDFIRSVIISGLKIETVEERMKRIKNETQNRINYLAKRLGRKTIYMESISWTLFKQMRRGRTL